MALKIISGVIVTRQKSGTAVIGFAPHRLISGGRETELADMKVIGTEESFRQVPAVMVALRELKIQIARDLLDHLDVFQFKINDEVERDKLTVKWVCKTTHQEGMDTSRIPEISYIVIGET